MPTAVLRSKARASPIGSLSNRNCSLKSLHEAIRTSRVYQEQETESVDCPAGLPAGKITLVWRGMPRFLTTEELADLWWRAYVVALNKLMVKRTRGPSAQAMVG